MTQAEADTQLMALTSARDRVIEVWKLMVPLIEQMAAEGNSLAAFLVTELELAEQNMALASMSAHAFVEENEKPA